LRAATLALALALAGAARPAAAYDPATTHAGLTERAVMASGLHRVLARRLGRPLGLFEPVVLRKTDLDAREARDLRARLASLDPSGGYRPGDDGAATAMAWVVAGAVIAQTPAEREQQNLFYDPSRGSGLANAGGPTQMGYSLRLMLDDGGLRDASTGVDFNLTGPPATAWLVSPANDVGLPVFYGALESAVSGEEPSVRATALARALMALGGTLSVLEDAGEPAHVRNDFRRAYLGSGGAGIFDRWSAFDRFVADAYGRGGVPAPAAPVERPTVMAYITAADAQGLADRTQRLYFSRGTVPDDVIVDRDTSEAEVLRDARASLPYGLPDLPRLELRAMGQRRYVWALGEGPDGRLHLTTDVARAAAHRGVRRVLAYERVPGRVRFFMDNAVYADSARALLPEIGGYAAGLIDHLFRGEVHLEVTSGLVRAGVTGARGAIHGGQVRIYAEDARGRRRLVAALPVGEDGALSAAGVEVPAGTRRVAAVLRAQDGAGELVAVGEQAL
jgi:hypothetical protein